MMYNNKTKQNKIKSVRTNIANLTEIQTSIVVEMKIYWWRFIVIVASGSLHSRTRIQERKTSPV